MQENKKKLQYSYDYVTEEVFEKQPISDLKISGF